MGTNFYWKPGYRLKKDANTNEDRYDPEVHIGKRSAAGAYCWDCDVTLCVQGPNMVHHGGIGESRKEWYTRKEWYKACPHCGKENEDDPLREGSGAVELGFAKPRTERPTGVRLVSSFSFAQPLEKILAQCRRYPDEKIIVSEYGDELTGQEFLTMLDANVPTSLRFNRVGRHFS